MLLPVNRLPLLKRGALFALSLAALAVPVLGVAPRAQAPAAAAPPAVINQSTDALLGSFRFRSIGPASMGGRIDDIAVSESDPNIIYLGYAVGGVFKSENNGVSGVVWAGTDDGNVQVSRDGGTMFTEVGKNMPGMPQNHQYWISRLDASHFDQGTAYVSVDGHRADDLTPYVFVTRDFGRTFQSISGNLPAYGNVQVVREDPKNKDLLTSARSSACSSRWTRGRTGRSS